jgi:diketogulonate reductase-like aldo/keto reductase
MLYKKFYDKTKIAAIGIGTWQIGGRASPVYSKDNEEIETIKFAIEKGLTHIDTAEFYGAGHSEEIIGKAIEGFNRNKLFITSKVWITNLNYDNVITACKKSLERLNINYLDLYLIHKPNPEVKLTETIKALNYLQDEKLVKLIGVSNFSLEQLIEARELSKYPIAALQIEYNIKKQNKELLNYCQRNNIILMAYTPTARGTLGEIQEVIEIAEKYKITPTQLGLNWLISKENLIAIPKASNHSHIKENAEAADIKINKEDLEKLDALSII